VQSTGAATGDSAMDAIRAIGEHEAKGQLADL
jgi:hypothetical protein